MASSNTPHQDPIKFEFKIERDENRRFRRACVMCAKSHLGCDGKRPCRRCIQKGYPQLCKENDMSRKKPNTTSSKRSKPQSVSEEESSEESGIEKNEEGSNINIGNQIRTFNLPMVSGVLPPAPPINSPIIPGGGLSNSSSSSKLTIVPSSFPPPLSTTAESLPPFSYRPIPSSHDNPSPSPHSINFLVEPFPAAPTNNNEKLPENHIMNRLITLEQGVRREMNSMREEIKQTHIQHNQIISTLSNMQKQLEGLFIIHKSNSPFLLTEDIPMAIWDWKSLRLISSNSAFEKLVLIPKYEFEKLHFRQLFPDFFLPIVETLLQNLMNVKEMDDISKIGINQIMAICPYNNLSRIHYVQFRAYNQYNQENQIEFVTFFGPLKSE